jgi:glycosyltransferase involved in cell wall biosynthesis
MALKVSVVIVTFYREQLVRRTLLSCLAQRDIDLGAVEIITVDGSPDCSARAVVDGLQEEARRHGATLRYIHEPRPGISHSRNVGVAAATADLVAFIDDDEEAEPHWLGRMLACQAQYNAAVVVGPVYPMFELERAGRDPFWRWYFTADSRQASGESAKRGAGTHNCLFVKRDCCVNDQPFDPALGLTGGEDSRFFQIVRQRGGRVVWCAEAIINEFIPASRTRWSFAWHRRLRESQLLLQLFMTETPPKVFTVALWMAIGFMQILVFAPLALAVAAFDRPTAMKYLAKTAGGVGKLLWFPGLTLIGYGDRSATQSAAPELGGDGKESAMKVSVQIMTFHRDLGLRRAVRSVLAQRGVDTASTEILIVDNSAEASARAAVEELTVEAKSAGYLMRYVHEKRPGIAQARNAGIRNAGADLVAYIDDDEEADPDWLAGMLATLDHYRADAVGGPVLPIFEDGRATNDPFWSWIYDYDEKKPSGSKFRATGTGNCLFYKSRCCPTDTPFDPALGLTGGSDTRFFHGLSQRGRKVVWCAEGIVHEYVPPARTQLAYGLRRRMRQSQLFIQTYSWNTPPNRRAIAKWMAVGLVQMAVYAPLTLWWWLIDRARAQRYLALVYGGMGKVFWTPRFTPMVYGLRPRARAN